MFRQSGSALICISLTLIAFTDAKGSESTLTAWDCSYAPVNESSEARAERLAKCYPEAPRSEGPRRKPLVHRAGGEIQEAAEIPSRPADPAGVPDPAPAAREEVEPYRRYRIGFGIQTDLHRVSDAPADDHTGFGLEIGVQTGDYRANISLGQTGPSLIWETEGTQAIRIGDHTSATFSAGAEGSRSVRYIDIGGGIMVHDPSYRNSVAVELLPGVIGHTPSREHNHGRAYEGGTVMGRVVTQLDLVEDLVKFEGTLQAAAFATEAPGEDSPTLYTSAEGRLTYLIPSANGFIAIFGRREGKSIGRDIAASDRVLAPGDVNYTIGIRAGAAK